jgi:hypothetical protein
MARVSKEKPEEHDRLPAKFSHAKSTWLSLWVGPSYYADMKRSVPASQGLEERFAQGTVFCLKAREADPKVRQRRTLLKACKAARLFLFFPHHLLHLLQRFIRHLE